MTQNPPVAALDHAPQTVKALTYPWGCDVAPEPGGVHPVAEGVWWLHMPLPFSLARINLWLLEDGDGWTVVDTGIGDQASRGLGAGFPARLAGASDQACDRYAHAS